MNPLVVDSTTINTVRTKYAGETGPETVVTFSLGLLAPAEKAVLHELASTGYLTVIIQPTQAYFGMPGQARDEAHARLAAATLEASKSDNEGITIPKNCELCPTCRGWRYMAQLRCKRCNALGYVAAQAEDPVDPPSA